MSMAEVHQTLESGKDIQLLDVRTAEEFNEGHVAGAMNVSVTDEGFEEGVVSLNKEKPIYVYCRSGKRSAKAAEILSELGFKVIYDVEGGITAWRNAGFPTEN